MTTRKTLRQGKKAATRQRIVMAAQKAFSSSDYNEVTIRDLAKSIDMSTGAIYANFETKEELFEAAMGVPPPLDGPLTRAAPMLLEALKHLFAEYKSLADSGDAGNWALEDTDEGKQAISAIALATSPLDGEVWSRHLSSIRRDEPHTLAAGEAAPVTPGFPAGAADQ